LPIVVKIFSGTKDCRKEIFSYQGKGNEVWEAQVFSNFWSDGANAVMVKDVSYAGGSRFPILLTCSNIFPAKHRAKKLFDNVLLLVRQVFSPAKSGFVGI